MGLRIFHWHRSQPKDHASQPKQKKPNKFVQLLKKLWPFSGHHANHGGNAAPLKSKNVKKGEKGPKDQSVLIRRDVPHQFIGGSKDKKEVEVTESVILQVQKEQKLLPLKEFRKNESDYNLKLKALLEVYGKILNQKNPRNASKEKKDDRIEEIKNFLIKQRCFQLGDPEIPEIAEKICDFFENVINLEEKSSEFLSNLGKEKRISLEKVIEACEEVQWEENIQNNFLYKRFTEAIETSRNAPAMNSLEIVLTNLINPLTMDSNGTKLSSMGIDALAMSPQKVLPQKPLTLNKIKEIADEKNIEKIEKIIKKIESTVEESLEIQGKHEVKHEIKCKIDEKLLKIRDKLNKLNFDDLIEKNPKAKFVIEELKDLNNIFNKEMSFNKLSSTLPDRLNEVMLKIGAMVNILQDSTTYNINSKSLIDLGNELNKVQGEISESLVLYVKESNKKEAKKVLKKIKDIREELYFLINIQGLIEQDLDGLMNDDEERIQSIEAWIHNFDPMKEKIKEHVNEIIDNAKKMKNKKGRREANKWKKFLEKIY